MAVDFSDYFWGEKNDGFNVLYQNMKCGTNATKELAEYFRERAKMEEETSKAQVKLVKQLGTVSPCGTFQPLVSAFKSTTEKLGSIHNMWMVKLTDLMKDVIKYSEELHKKHKQVKDEESPTLESVKNIQDTTALLQKAKELYKIKCMEVEKLKRDNASQKDLEKAEAKFRKAQEDYKALVDRYCGIRDEFEKKMTSASKHFQEVETSHLMQMREFVESYCQIVDNNNNEIGKVHAEFQIQLAELTVENLLQEFTLAKYTGLEKPGPAEFEEEKLSVASFTGGPPSDISDKSGNSVSAKSKDSSGPPGVVDSPHVAVSADHSEVSEEPQSPTRSPYTSWTVPGFLKRNKKKSKSKKNKEDDSVDKDFGSDGEEKSQTPTPEVGYSKQATSLHEASDPWADFNRPKGSFYSSSDESDDEKSRKIKVEIKPVSNGKSATSASVDELQSAVGRLELIPLPSATREPFTATSGDSIQRSKSQSHINKPPSLDLLGLQLHPIEPIDPVDEEKHPLPKPLDTSNLSTSSATSKEVREIIGDWPETQPTLPPKQNPVRPSSTQREMISNSLKSLPRPPSRGVQRSQQRTTPSPVPSSLLGDSKFSIARQDSQRSDSFSQRSDTSSQRTDSPAFKSSGDGPTAAFGTSRGPSPLTLSMSEVVPLAVAFQEVCHACFRGADETQCQVRQIGDMMISFPAGIIQVLTTNPHAAPLVFRIKNAPALESIVANKQLISQSPTDSSTYEFNMKALKELLRKQADQNPNASYFNIDILKYQIKSKTGAGSCPLQMVAYWKCTKDHTDLRLDYKYNGHAMAAPMPLLNLTIAVPIDGGVLNMQSKPNGTWLPDANRALWKFPELSMQTDAGVGSLRGRFELSNGPGSQGTIAAQFNCEGTTLSGVDFELVGFGYRLSLVKKRFVSGKYVSDGDAGSDNRYRYAAPPSSSETTEC